MTPARAQTQPALNLVPMPREIEFGKGDLTLSADWTVSIQDLHPDDLYPAEQIAADALRCFGWTWKVQKSIPEKNYILLKGFTAANNPPRLFMEQGYLLRVEADRIVIEAPSATGRFYGAQTVRQLLRQAAGTKRIPLLKIEDYPALEWRGISDDISRGQVSTLDDFTSIIEQLAYYKKNMYQPYIEDMFRFDVSPNVGADRGAVTKTEMARMVEEAKRNHITLTPVFETLGHQDRLLSLPENKKYAELQDPDKTPWSFAPVNPEAFEFVTELVDEMAASTPSPFFHIGGDESWDVGEGVSKDAVKELGVGKVHADYYTRLVNYIKKKHDRRTMLYGDMMLKYPEALEDLAKESIIVDWHYNASKEGGYPSVETIRKAGFENIFVSPGIWGWANFYPNDGMGFTNVGEFVMAGKKQGAMGSITSSWGDRGAENLRVNNLHSYAFSAAVEWETGCPGDEEFLARFVSTQFAFSSDKLATAYKTIGWLDYLESNYKDGMFHRELHVKPLTPEWAAKMKRLEGDMKFVREAVAGERKKARINGEQLDGVDHAARRYLYMAQRDLALHDIATTLGDKTIADLPAADRKALRARIESLRDELVGIVDEFTRLWLRDNKFPKLDFNLARLQEQVADLQSLVSRCQEGVLAQDPPPKGTWFWYPEKNPLVETTVESPKFVRVFELKEIPNKAVLKCWADDRATVYLNDHKLFRTTYPEDPKSAEARQFLREGTNVIAIEARNSVGAAGILLELTMDFPDKSTVTISGDSEWRGAEKMEDGWMTRSPEGDAWKPVMLLGTGAIEPWTFLNW